jgi:adenosylmethionine-8-amino-7-oxononanoate aminotransferase
MSEHVASGPGEPADHVSIEFAVMAELAEDSGRRADLARRGVLTRPIGNVVVLMPPYCATPAQVRRMVGALHEAIDEILESCRPERRASQ